MPSKSTEAQDASTVDAEDQRAAIDERDKAARPRRLKPRQDASVDSEASASGGGEAAVIAWIWARTVRSPDPSWGGHVPLVRSWVLRKARKNKPTVWVEPVVDRPTRTVSYRIRERGTPPNGTVKRQGGTCLATDTPIKYEYIREQGREGLLDRHLIAIVAEGPSGRTYLAAHRSSLPEIPNPDWKPSAKLSGKATVSVPLYGLSTWADLFTDRQLAAMSTFSDLLGVVRPIVEEHARATGLADDGVRLRDGGSGATAYADAVVTYLAFSIDRCADYWSSLTVWENRGGIVAHMFGRQAIPMVWDYPEANPVSESSGNW